MKTQLENFGLQFSEDSRNVKIEATLGSMRRFYDATPKLVPEMSRANKAEHDDKWDDNAGRREGFCGGTRTGLLSAMTGKVDLVPFEAAKNRLAGTGLLQKLQTRMADVTPKRKRVMSEHDGEWSLDRRYEIKPFAATQKVRGSGRTVKVVCEFGINSSASAESINEYGAMAWAIVEIIEKAGITCEIIHRGQFINSYPGANKGCVIDIRLKKPGEYMAPALLAATFSSNFYRRAVFAAIVAGGEWSAQRVHGSLGSAFVRGAPIAFKNGELTLLPDCRNATTEELATELLKALA